MIFQAFNTLDKTPLTPLETQHRLYNNNTAWKKAPITHHYNGAYQP